LGREHEDTLRTQRELVETLNGFGRFAESEEILRDVIGKLFKTQGKKNPSTLKAQIRLADYLNGGQRYREAEEIGSMVLALCEAEHGLEDIASWCAWCLVIHITSKVV
jgi:hypothetical protein